jgi:MarR family transcriptional regulator, transcriptional regulator for hemolysin
MFGVALLSMNTHEIFHTINQLSRYLTNRINEELKPLGIYSSQWTVIYVLKTKGSLTQKELCQYLAIEAPPMTRTIQRLQTQGYVKQIQGKDKREKYIQLTEEALSKFPSWEAATLEVNDSLLSALPSHSHELFLKQLKGWYERLS